MTRIPGTTFHDEEVLDEEFGRLKRELAELQRKAQAAITDVAGMTIQGWLDDQARLQVEAYGDTGDPKEGEEFALSAMMNATALTVELGELMNELSWKPWSASRGRPDPEHRLKAVLELVDMMHFVANIFLLLGVDAEEFKNVWRHKQQVNRDRQARGYDATAPGEKLDGRATDDDPALAEAKRIRAGLEKLR